MAQVSQIVPKFSFPYVETHINDYTTVSNDTSPDSLAEPVVRYIFPFTSSKGIDNKFIKYHGKSNIIKAYGNSNYKKYGQPLMQVLNVATSVNAEIWCMRVMPENAEYARNIVSVYYKGDTTGSAHDRKFRIKFIKKSAQKEVISTDDLGNVISSFEKAEVITSSDLQKARYVGEDTTTVDDEGYKCIPGVFTFRSTGRGEYGNDYRVRASQNINYEKDYGVKFYNFEILSSETGLSMDSQYTGSMVTSTKYEATTFINDVLDDADVGTVPVFIRVDEDGVEDVYNEYIAWLEQNIDDLKDEIEVIKTPIEIDAHYTGTIITGRYSDNKFYEIDESSAIDEDSVVRGYYQTSDQKFYDTSDGEVTPEAGKYYYDTTADKYYVWDADNSAYVETVIGTKVTPTITNFYYDTTADKYYVWDGSAYVETTYDDSKEVTPVTNRVYYDTTADKYYVWDGSAYVETTPITDGMVVGTEVIPAELKSLVLLIRKIKELLNKSIPSLDEFDLLFGRDVASTESSSFIAYPKIKTDDIDETASDYNPDDYITVNTENVIYFDDVTGIKLEDGTDGYFKTPRVETTVVDGYPVETKWTVDQEVEECYKKAFSGEYDKRILSAKRLKADALWDANYPMSVKSVIADLTLCRNDGLCYLDAGILDNFSSTTVQNLISDFSAFDDHKISKNIHSFITRESNTKKRVRVTISYFLSRKFADHVVNNGSYVPFVKSYAQLDNFIKDTLYPTIEDYDTDLKELLVENRFNYFDVVDDAVYQRATQNTSQITTSDLLEENNVHTLYEMKRIVEKDISDRLYDFTDSVSRQNFRDYEVAKFQNWSNKQVQSFDIEFRMNAWEAERSILHAYISVVFRGLQKRAILEIDINKRTYEDDVTNDNDSFSS